MTYIQVIHTSLNGYASLNEKVTIESTEQLFIC